MFVSRTQGKIAIIFAMPSEAKSLKKVLSESYIYANSYSNFTSCFVGKAELLIAVSGIGINNCIKTAQMLIDHGAQWIISAGTSAGLHPDINVGDVLIANSVMSVNSYDKVFHCNSCLTSASPPSGAFGFSICQGNVITSEKVIYSSSQKERIYKSSGAAALDMESYAIAGLCKKHDIPFGAVKSICDSSSQDMPSETAVIASLDKVSQILFTATRPHLWMPLCRLQHQVNKASGNLGDVLAFMIMRLL